MKKKTCDNKKQNSFDIKTNPTLLGKKAKPLFSSGKILWDKKNIGKKTKKKRKPLFQEHLSFENFFYQNRVSEENLSFNRKTFFS